MFTFPISHTTRQWAQARCKGHQDTAKIRQIYLNAIAVQMVAHYLRCMGFEADIHQSQLNHPALRAVMDVADLAIARMGRLECRPVLPHATTLLVPPEVRHDRLGYVAVQVNPELTQAQVLGFVATVPANGEIPLTELRSLETLPDYLDRWQPTDTTPARERLSDWWQDLFGPGWQTLEALLGTPQPALALGLRGPAELQATSLQRAKLIDLGLELGQQRLILLVAIAPARDHPEEFTLLVQLHPAQGEPTLPANLALTLRTADQEPLQSVRSRSQDNYIQLKRFQASREETFEVVIAYGDAQVTEAFAV